MGAMSYPKLRSIWRPSFWNWVRISFIASEQCNPLTVKQRGKEPSRDWRQIMNARTLNCGQMCIAPDYVLCHEQKMDAFVESVVQTAGQWFEAKESRDAYVGRIVREWRLWYRTRAVRLCMEGRMIGRHSRLSRPLLSWVSGVTIGMREETFGPVLWLKSVRSVSEAVAYINARPKPWVCICFLKTKRTKTRQNTKYYIAGGSWYRSRGGGYRRCAVIGKVYMRIGECVEMNKGQKQRQ